MYPQFGHSCNRAQAAYCRDHVYVFQCRSRIAMNKKKAVAIQTMCQASPMMNDVPTRIMLGSTLRCRGSLCGTTEPLADPSLASSSEPKTLRS